MSKWTPLICVVGFHHARGPEIESWHGLPTNAPDPASPSENDWAFLPFMALADGAHTSTEDFSYFTLRRKAAGLRDPYSSSEPGSTGSGRANENVGGGSLFGMSCTRQLDARELLHRPDDVTRSTVQKSVVVIDDSPLGFAKWREKLSVVTKAWFLQKDFSNVEILDAFQASLVDAKRELSDRDPFVGVSLREFIFEHKQLSLVLFKCCLLQRKMLFFSTRCERLCMIQFALISLIPNLLQHMDDCASPEMDLYASTVMKPTSLKSSERDSLLAYMGLPLQIFGKGSLFGPYTPLQQLDVLVEYDTKSYIVGSTNSLLLQQKDRYSDILINLDELTVTISSSSLRSALSLTAADRRWIDFLYTTIAENYDPSDPSRTPNYAYLGSEEFIRLQFEEYLLALLSCTKYHLYLYSTPEHIRNLAPNPEVEGDPSIDFSESWIDNWKSTENFKLWNRTTESSLFDLIPPRHPTAGGLSLEDINRRMQQQIADLHIDEKFAASKKAVGETLAIGQARVSTAMTSVWEGIESIRATQRARRTENRYKHQSQNSKASLSSVSEIDTLPSPSKFDTHDHLPSPSPSTPSFPRDLSTAQAAVGAVGAKAGAYLSSWSAWAGEKRKGWTERDDGSSTPRSAGLAGLSGWLSPRDPDDKKTMRFGGLSMFSTPNSPRTVEEKVDKVPRRILRQGASKEHIGRDGIGRLDA